MNKILPMKNMAIFLKDPHSFKHTFPTTILNAHTKKDWKPIV